MSLVELSETQWKVIEAIADAVITPQGAAELQRIVPHAPSDAVAIIGTKSPSQLPDFRLRVQQLMGNASDSKIKPLKVVLSLLGTTGLALPLTGTYRTFQDLSITERWSLLNSLRVSRVPQLRGLARSLLDLSTFAYLYSDPMVIKTFGYVDPNPILESLKGYDLWETPIASIPPAVGKSIPQIEVDVVIVGSGSSAGVAAHDLSKQGYKVLVLEKAKYLHPSEVGLTDYDKDFQAYEQGGKLMSQDNSMTVIAGSTIGGGAAVNWSCSLDTPKGVRKLWAKDVPWYESTRYDDALDYVKKVMEVTLDFGPHSFTNQLILDGAKKLEYAAKPCPQNTGRHIPNNRFHGYGYRYGDKGGVVNWFYYATEHGTQIIDQAEVLRIRHRNGYAVGVDVRVAGKPLIVSAKKVVVAAGSVNTPGVLIRSGFKNKGIGRGLKLHPVTVLSGDFGELTVNKPQDTIMTAVCTHSDNLDGQYHGPKIEAIHHTPIMVSKFLPWRQGTQFLDSMARYKHLSALLIITRDRTNGRVGVESGNPMRPLIEYSTNAYDLWALKKGCVTGAELLYVQGALKIFSPNPDVEDFVATVPADKRRVHDTDFVAWLKKLDDSTFDLYKIGTGSAHQMASCRMSNKGSGYSPVDDRGRLYECQNVHVIDTSVFPSASGANPMISCMATSRVLTGFLIEDLQKTANRQRL